VGNPLYVIHYLGPEGTHSHEAALQFARLVGSDQFALPVAVASIESVVSAVADSKDVHVLGCVPLENSIQGSVTQTWDTLLQAALDSPSQNVLGKTGNPQMQLQASLTLPINHYLLTRNGAELSEITEVLSHPQALLQCRKWLQQQMPNARTTPVASTADAAHNVFQRVGANIAAIAGRTAALCYDLETTPEPIQDESNNVTRFGLIGRSNVLEDSGLKHTTAVCLLGVSNRPGGLLHALKPFDDAQFNLSRIESRPIGHRLGEYVFFLDVTTTASSANWERADAWKSVLYAMNGLGIQVVHLGSYGEYTL